MLRGKRLHTIRTADKALELLQVVANGEQHLTINALAQRLKVGREEVLLLLVAMENQGLVSWDGRRKVYTPGWTTLEMARMVGQRFDRLSSRHGATASLY